MTDKTCAPYSAYARQTFIKPVSDISPLKEKILRRTLEQFTPGSPLTAESIRAVELPEPLRHFLILALERRIGQELADVRIPSTPWIDSSASAFGSTVDEFHERLASFGQFPAEEVGTYVQRAVEIVVDYSLNPVETLVNFIFIRGATETSTEDLRRRASYFYAYPHLIDAIAKIVDHTDHSSTTQTVSRVLRTDLSESLMAVDRNSGKNCSAEGWMALVKPICDLYAYASGHDDRIPPVLIAEFIQGRGDSKLAATVRALSSSPDQEISMRELSHRIADAVRPAEPVRPVISPRTSTNDPVRDGELPLWKQYASNAAPTGPPGAQQSVEQPLWKQYATSETTIADENSNSFDTIENRVLGTAKKFRNQFVRDLFEGEQGSYEYAINALARSGSWRESAEFLKTEVFVKNRVDIYSESAIAFTNAVEEHIKQFS